MILMYRHTHRSAKQSREPRNRQQRWKPTVCDKLSKTVVRVGEIWLQ